MNYFYLLSLIVIYSLSFVFVICYSYRNASIGCKFAALLAGYQPKRIPIAAETIKARSTDTGETIKSDPVSTE